MDPIGHFPLIVESLGRSGGTDQGDRKDQSNSDNTALREHEKASEYKIGNETGGSCNNFTGRRRVARVNEADSHAVIGHPHQKNGCEIGNDLPPGIPTSSVTKKDCDT